MRIYYFGCWGRVGHHLWTPEGRYAADDVVCAFPWPFLDTSLCPGRRNRFGDVNPLEQRDGWAALHRKDGWTALAFWDRSVDKRHGSNSAFVADEVLDVAAMLEASTRAFPGVMARLTFPILVEP